MRAGVAALAVCAGVWWMASPAPLVECLQEEIARDKDALADNRVLAGLGTVAEQDGRQLVAFPRSQFFACTRYKTLTLDWPPAVEAAEAYKLLRDAPSFEFGRQLARLSKEAPELAGEERVATARLMRATDSMVEALAQMRACPDIWSADATALTDFQRLGEPYLTAVIWNLGLAKTPAEARDNAATLIEISASTVVAPECTSPRFASELKAIRLFKGGRLPGLPCHVSDRDGEPELQCD